MAKISVINSKNILLLKYYTINRKKHYANKIFGKRQKHQL